MWDLEKIDSQNLEVQETKNIVRHPEGVQKEEKFLLKDLFFFFFLVYFKTYPKDPPYFY